LFFVFLFIKRNFTDKIDIITKNIENKRLIDDKSISLSNDELSIIAKKYNTLFDSLNKEIEINKELLKENKRFIADTVHQIRTPLTNIMMNSEMIQRTLKNNKVSNFVNQIDASINMLTNSYEDLAYIISHEHIEYKPAKVSISNILKERVKFFTTISKVNYKEIVANIEEDIFITINQIELERLIDNNISNGIKYAFTNKPITINLTRKDDEVVLEFKTYGKPIANKDKLFEKNYRENESKRGLGLGLNMVKTICEKYDISYKVTYEDGQNIFVYIFKMLKK
jgi:signal transduction histidine kinase